MRKTFMREKGSKKKGDNPGLWRVMSAELAEAAEPIISNFTFALLMTCVGIVVILLAIVYASVLK